MKNPIFELSRRIVSEQRYLALKDSPKFQHKMGSSSKQGSRYIERLIIITYVITTVSILIFSTILVFSDLPLNQRIAHLQSTSLILYAYIFLISTYSVLMFTNILRNYKLFEPIKVLPANIGPKILPLSWFVFNGSSSLFVAVPVIVEFFLHTGNYFSIIFGTVWAFLIMILGYISGCLVVYVMARGSSHARHGHAGTFSNIARISGVIAFFIFFEIAIQTPKYIPVLPSLATNPEFLLVPLLNVAYIAFPYHYLPSQILFGTLVTMLYGALIILLFRKVNSMVFLKITETESAGSSGMDGSKLRISKAGFYRTIFTKEVRNIFRKPQNATMMLIPIFLVLPTLLSLFIYSSSISFGSISIYYSMLSIVIVSSSFYSIALIISEGNGISVLQSLPLTLRDIIYSKNYVGTVIFSIIVIPISTIFLFKNNVDSLILFLLPANLIVAYSYTSLFNLRRLMKKVPKGSTTINFYSFGGNMALLILFAITAGFTAVPAVASTIISTLAVQVPFSHPLSFYLSDLALNLGALFVVMNLVNKTM
ncbi:MAG: hypothetical protein M0T81_03095 [Thermoplasmatales archaeon]|nr:hypothetical protein [Thermoplasmatales archaeon]